MEDVGEGLSCAIEKDGVGDELLKGMHNDLVCSLLGFDGTHLSFYHEHLVGHPSKARALCYLSFAHK